MIEKIEKVLRVKRIDNDVGRPFEDPRQNGGRSFLDELNRAFGKKNDNKPAKISEPYALELTGTQSLFYYCGLDLEALLQTR